ncbi:D-alanyl-D-alanine carboxypeptidase family protein [Streptomyces abyssomicinicus]|uniref:D-alanyl-D-alanine carboxypeptidase family protein n=1 Tax=Streptomyces abyssomicinicus TaxID=574929 RepID=UPI001FE49C83|nr:D-alanyl-D-alanine carboxypeptidase [Streptomyces abyssomicinicus]
MPAQKKTAKRPVLIASAALFSLALGLVVPLSAGDAQAQPARPGPKSPGSRLSGSTSAGSTSAGGATSSPSTSTGDRSSADDASPAASGVAKDAPPAGSRSTVGGARLAAPGTQVAPNAGAPALPDDLSAKSWIVADAESGEVLAAHNAHQELAPASTLKMLFADTLLGHWPATDTHKVTDEELSKVGSGSSMVGVKPNETYTVRDLWLGVFLQSGNDAVHVLSSMNGGLDRTVADMNAHAAELQALDTHVVSPDGYDAKGQVSSAYDLTLIARSGLQKKDFREYASTVRAQFPGETKKGKDGKKTRGNFEIQNTNRLLTGNGIDQYRGIAGVKNGNTTNAGATFTGVAERDGKVLLVTVMNPQKKELNRVYKETAELLDWGFAAAGKVTPVGELVPPASAASAAPSAAPSASSAAMSPAGGRAENVAASEEAKETGPVWIPFAIVGGVLVLLAGGAFLVHRRWPLPGTAARSGSRSGAKGAAEGADAGAADAGVTEAKAGDSSGTEAAASDGATAKPAGAEADAKPADAEGATSEEAGDPAGDKPAEAAEAAMPQQASGPRAAEKGEGQPA